MKNEFTTIKKTIVRRIKNKIDSVDSSTENCNFKLDDIIKIAKENKYFYCVDIPHNEIKIVKTEKYPCVFEDLKGNKKVKIITQENIYIFS
jgi:hypothetical protein